MSRADTDRKRARAWRPSGTVDPAQLRWIAEDDPGNEWMKLIPDHEKRHGLRASELIELGLKHMPSDHPDRARLIRDLNNAKSAQLKGPSDVARTVLETAKESCTSRSP